MPLVWESDIIAAGLQAAGQLYSSPGFDAPGAVVTVTLVVNPATMSASTKDLRLPVATTGTAGTFTAVVAPAVNPSTGVPDPLLLKTGTWAVAGEVQNVAVSGQPAAAGADGENDAAGVAAGGGHGLLDPDSGENTVHNVAVVLEDIDGNKLVAHRIAIATPDGRRSEHVLTAAGAARVDRIRAEGEAVVQLLEAEIRPPLKRPDRPWIALTLLGPDGEPLEGAEVEITTPDGAKLVQVTGPKGSLRIDNLREDGDCRVVLVRGDGASDGQTDSEELLGGDAPEEDSDTGSDNDEATDDTQIEYQFTMAAFPNAPQAGRSFQISAPGNSVAGVASDDGSVVITLSSSTTEADLLLEAEAGGFAESSHKMTVGPLGPAQDVDAFFERLRNLGYYRDVLPEEDEAERKTAIEEFQCDHLLSVDGVKGAQTEGKLLEVHGS